MHWDAFVQQQRGVGAAKVVKLKSLETELVRTAPELLRERAGVPRLGKVERRGGEDQGIVG